MTTNTTAKAFDFTVKPTPQGTFQICYRESGQCYDTEYQTGIAAQNAINSKFNLPLIPLPDQEVEEVVESATPAFTQAEVQALQHLLQATIEDRAFRPAARKANKELYQSILAQL